MRAVASPEQFPTAVRAYTGRSRRRKIPTPNRNVTAALGASVWTLVFDTETTTDAAQRLRFGVYQLRKSGVLRASGIFHDPLTLSDSELSLLRKYAHDNGLEIMTSEQFVERIFLRYVYDLSALCIGFNLPFDLSRIATGHSSARGRMRGGFSFKLTDDKYRPRIQIKHLSNRAALIRFTVPAKQRASRGMRNRGFKVTPHRGYFVDVRTFAGALLGGSWSLGRLAEHLDTEHGKLDTDEHGGPLTEEYIGYAVRDVQATWECFEHLNEQYEGYGLIGTQAEKIYSEASLGKAYLKQMGVKPWRELQPDFPPALLGIIMSTYYGGRSEVHIRREVTRVLYCDFLSMYPTVCTLMGLWRFVTAEGMERREATGEVREFLERVTLEDLQKSETWPKLRALVQVRPDAGIFPARARYGEESQYTIGLNHLTSEEPLWYTLADCIASKILTGKVPEVVKALRFEPVNLQEDLSPINIAGNHEYRIDPQQDDFYKKLIDLRSEVKVELKAAKRASDTERATILEAEQLALKICANATSYGIFVELNVQEQSKLQDVTCHGYDGKNFPVKVRNVEEPGRYFHPLLATLITGCARLMLAMGERLAEDVGITWAFCDTDSIALAKPKGMSDAEFLERAGQVQDWFTALNPYEHKGPLFKIEDANYRIERGKLTDEIEPLYCLAVSAKRYALFNLDKRGRPMMRKVSAHGLGHLLSPYGEDEAPKKIPNPIVSLSDLGGVERWHHDLWHRIVQAALGDKPRQVKLFDLPGFQKPAVSRYAATTPSLLRWFKRFNAEKPYREQVRPFGFMLAFQTRSVGLGKKALKPVSPYSQNSGNVAEECFDRETGEPVPGSNLKSYQRALAQYHLHPEAKFLGGDYVDRGVTRRRHIVATAIEHIGKEANRWEEQFHLGLDLEAQTEYGISPGDRRTILRIVRQAVKQFRQRALAEAAGVSLRDVSKIVRGKQKVSPTSLIRLYHAVSQLKKAAYEQEKHEQEILDEVRESCKKTSIRRFAKRAGMDAANLSHVLNNNREPSPAMLALLTAAITREQG